MTGTPIQNSLEDLGTLVRFLKLPIMEDLAVFRKHICVEAEQAGSGRGANFSNLRRLLGSICLRRQQSFPSASFAVRPTFSTEEKNSYRSLEIVCKQALIAAVNSKNSNSSHRNVLEKLLRLREFCNGISPSENNSPERLFSLLRQAGETYCFYCTVEISDLDPGDDNLEVRLTPCQRFVCSDRCCTLRYASELGTDGNGRPKCPFCGMEHGTENLLAEGAPDERPELPKTFPSKLMALLQDIQQNMKQEKW